MNNPDHPDNTKGARLRRTLSKISSFELRDAWWQMLDLLEKRRALRLALYAAGVVVVLGTVAAIWVYPWWRQRTVVSMSRQWLDSGRLDQASVFIQEALKVAPENPESWKLAADLARRLGNHENALGYSKKAHELAPTGTDLILAWAADALLAGQPDECTRALASLPPDILAQSAHAQRISGELARRRFRLTEARDHFETALRIDGSDTPINEVPLGTILLNSRDPADRQRGIDLLTRWTTSVEWGANALRNLLQDAIARDNRATMVRWADALRSHPRCTLGDIPNCLLALSKTDETRFDEVLAILQKQHARDPKNVALLVGWLNQIGRTREALEWTRQLPDDLTRRAPAKIVIAESLRGAGDWSGLSQWTDGDPWEGALEFLRLIYRLEAALQSGRALEASELQKTLQDKGAGSGGQILFAASTLYTWNRPEQALPLLWIAAEQTGSAFEALGTLARHYQELRDAEGQFRVFRRLRTLRAEDATIANNYVFFATLTGQDLIAAEKIAERNFTREPANLAYRATHAFVFLVKKQPAAALKIMEPVSDQWRVSPPVAFAYGLSLAANARKTEAREILETLPTGSLSDQEVVLIKAALR